MITFEEERIAYYFELGRALSAWTVVEQAMTAIVLACFDENAHPAVGMGFVKIEGFRSKIYFLDGAVQRAFAGKSVRKEWPDLLRTRTGWRLQAQ